MKRAEFYTLSLICEAGHRHPEALARVVSSDAICCEICGRPIVIRDEDRNWACRMIEDLKKIGPEREYVNADE